MAFSSMASEKKRGFSRITLVVACILATLSLTISAQCGDISSALTRFAVCFILVYCIT